MIMDVKKHSLTHTVQTIKVDAVLRNLGINSLNQKRPSS